MQTADQITCLLLRVFCAQPEPTLIYLILSNNPPTDVQITVIANLQCRRLILWTCMWMKISQSWSGKPWQSSTCTLCFVIYYTVTEVYLLEACIDSLRHRSGHSKDIILLCTMMNLSWFHWCRSPASCCFRDRESSLMKMSQYLQK